MTNKADFELLIKGTRDEKPIKPNSLDIDEMINIFSNVKDLLYPEGSSKRPKITTRIEEGSVRFILTTTAAIVIQTHALLAEVNESKNLGILPPKQQKAIQFFQKIAIKDHLSIQFGIPKKLKKGLYIDHSTILESGDPTWLPVELYVTGEVVNIGGKSKSNIHLDTKEFGTLIIEAPKELLLMDEQNRVYKKQEIRIKIMQNVDSGEYDTKTAEIIEFIDNDLKGEKPDEYLDRLIQKASGDWKAVTDSEAWLKKIRGYEG